MKKASVLLALLHVCLHVFACSPHDVERYFRTAQRLTHVHNTCIAKYVDGNVMDGWWIQGKLLKGLLRGADHSEYHGEFEDGKFDGEGFLKYPDGSSYHGKWEVYRAGWRECRAETHTISVTLATNKTHSTRFRV
jgi:hypothetical protein